MDRGGDDPATAGFFSQDAHADEPQKKSKHKGSLQLRHRNMKIAAYKRLHAPCRALTKDELKNVNERADAEFAEHMADPATAQAFRSFETGVARQSDRSRSSTALVAAGAGVTPPKPFNSLWGEVGTGRGHILSPQRYVEAIKNLERCALGEVADTAIVHHPPKRCEPQGLGWTPLCGCHSFAKKRMSGRRPWCS